MPCMCDAFFLLRSFVLDQKSSNSRRSFLEHVSDAVPLRVLCLMHDMRHYGCAAAYLYEDNLGVHFSCVTSLGGPKFFRGFSTSRRVVF